jgi:nucleotide-binding universal stress UspA family protein
VDTAIEQDVDVIVMTTHGRSGFSRWMMGSVAERVLREAKCPVMVTRHDKQAKRILIPLDGSVLSEQALPIGFSLAEANGATVHLMRVHESSSESAQAAIEAYLDGCVAKREEDIEVKTAVIHGSPASSIIDYVEKNEIDLIVLATHGRRGVHRWVYGSVTEKILRGIERNILVVRPQ